MSEIRVDISDAIAQLPVAEYQEKINEIHARLHSGQNGYTGWVEYPTTVEGNLVWQIMTTAWKIQKQCTAFVVIGVGGSYLGAKACLELLQSPFYNEFFAKERNLPKIYFAGHHLSSVYYHELFHRLRNEEVAVCVISRSGATLEPMIVFEMFKKFMNEKYGDAARERIYVITGSKGKLREEANQKGYTTFDVPDDIVGRFSVLTPVGLLPIAVAGIDLEAVLQGARQAQAACMDTDLNTNDCYRYALTRHLLKEQQDKRMEVFEVYDGKLRYFTEWLKQLFGESECQHGQGLFPVSMQMSTDLHSLGQFLQDGRQDFFETAVIIEDVTYDIMLPEGITDHAKTLHQMNNMVRESVKEAHLENNTPNIVITLPEISSYSFGKMVYFFEKACAVSCMLSGLDPFVQPGGERYKEKLLGFLKDDTVQSAEVE